MIPRPIPPGRVPVRRQGTPPCPAGDRRPLLREVLWLTARGVVLLAVAVVPFVGMACQQPASTGTPSTTQPNRCGETGVCEGSLGLDAGRGRSGGLAAVWSATPGGLADPISGPSLVTARPGHPTPTTTEAPTTAHHGAVGTSTTTGA